MLGPSGFTMLVAKSLARMVERESEVSRWWLLGSTGYH